MDFLWRNSEIDNLKKQLTAKDKEIKELTNNLKESNAKVENLEFDLKDSENEIHAKIGREEYVKIKYLVDFTIYEDQRPLNLDNVDKIVEHQEVYYTEVGYFQDNLPFIIAYHPDKKKVFRNKSKTGDRTDEIVIDGQHRLVAFRKMLANSPEIGNKRMFVRYIPCFNMDDAHKEFLDINSGIPLENADFDKNKAEFSYADVIHNFVDDKIRDESIYNDFYNVSRAQTIRRQSRGQFYSKLFLRELKRHNNLKEMIKDLNLYADELFDYFDEFNELKLEELKQKDVNTYSFEKKKQNSQMKIFLEKIQNRKYQVLSWVYYKKWNVLVDDFCYFMADKMDYELEDSEDSE